MTPRKVDWPRLCIVRALCLAAALALWAAGAQAAQIVSVSGEVELGRGEPAAWEPARAGAALDAGDRVRTGDEGRAELALDGATLRLYPNSLLRLPPAAGEAGVELERGTSLFDVLRRGDRFDVRTPEVVVSVKGTRFSVALEDGAAAVAVFRGLVGVRSLASEQAFETLVREGFTASGRESFALTLHSGSDPWESWSQGTLERVPQPHEVVPPAKAAALEAREAARAAALGEAVERAGQRHPHLGEKLEGLRAGGPGAASQAPDGGPAGHPLDPIADSQGRSMALQSEMVESWLNGALGSTGAVLGVTVVNAGGAVDQVLVDVAGTASWAFDETYLEDVLTGDDALPAELSTLLQSGGVEEQAVVGRLLDLLR
jgi:hypothetical protein